jgi:polyketide biosynthesis enoyl-CoA hydratase PksH
MGIVSAPQSYDTLQVRFQAEICFIQIHRPAANNTIDARLIEEFAAVLDLCEREIKIVVIEGLPEVFCFGADFKAIQHSFAAGDVLRRLDPRPMYKVWLRLASGPYITVAHVRGQANAGGIGFVAACDLVLCEEKATFSLSELLFGLMPACVLPFLMRRLGFARANYLTLMTEPITASCAREWGLVDEYAADSQNLLRRKLLRLRRLPKTGIQRYKRYMNTLNDSLTTAMPKALEANIEVFSDTANLEKIARFATTGQFPWEGE